MGFQQSLTGKIEPNDPVFRAARSSIKRRFYSHAGDVALARLKVQLGRGIGSNGRTMKPRIRAVLPDGADGPVMEPHYDKSRVITLSDYMATDHGLTLFWHAGTSHRSYRRARKQGKTPAKFHEILGFHARGEVPRAPVRDVRLSKASIAQVRIEMLRWWEREKQRLHLRRVRRPPNPDMDLPDLSVPPKTPLIRPGIAAAGALAGIALIAAEMLGFAPWQQPQE
jgi:hypothetical protein